MDHDELPQLRLDAEALEHNIRLMADWCAERGVELSPHIKTTMTRPVVERQLAAGAWGVTVATTRQAGIALSWGIRRVIIANEVVHGPDLLRLRGWLDEFPELELYCLVDSAEGLRRAGAALADVRNPLRLLVDVGDAGGRTGVRDATAAVELGAAVRRTPGVVPAGVAGYEGIRPNVRAEEVLAQVDEHCRRAVGVLRELAPHCGAGVPLFTMGGSAFPDRVVRAVAEYAGEPGAPHVRTVLRSGCYVTHDHGTYAAVSPLPELRPALSVRAVVLSAPEPGLVVVGAGRRELPYDAGLPVLLGAADPEAQGTAERIFDHHLVLTGAAGLTVGDHVDLGISHPCSAFDRWPAIAVTGPGGEVREWWHPQFH